MKSNSYLASLMLVVAVAAGAPAAAAQERVRAYVLIDTSDAADMSAVHGALGSLSNCKALVESLWPGESIAHVDCSDIESLNRFVVEEIPAIDGVEQATTWMVEKQD